MLIRELTSGKIIGLDRRMTVGSAASPDVVFAIPEEHPGWCIVARGNRYVLTPLDPRAKVRVNGQPIPNQRTLKVGDEIEVGDATYRLEPEKVLAKDDAAATVGVAGDEQTALARRAAAGAEAKANSETRAFIESDDGEVVAIDMSDPSKETGDAVQDLIDDVVEAWEDDDKPVWAGGGRGKDEKAKPKRQERQRAERKRAIKRGDGPLDVGQSIKEQIKRVDIEQLAKSKQHVKLLRMDVIEELVQSAVSDTAERMGTELDEDARNKMLKETVEEFQERLAAFTAEKEGLEAQQKQVQRELERAQRMLEEERKKQVSADQFTVSDAGVVELEKQFERLVGNAAKKNGLDRAFQGQLHEMVQGLLDAEREKIAEQARQAQSKAIAILEKKVARLAGGMEEAEKERDQAVRRAKALEAAGVGGGIANVMEAGISDDDENKQKKLELMKHIFEENRALRDVVKGAGRRLHTRVLRAKEIKAEEARRAALDAHRELAEARFSEAKSTEHEAPKETPAEASVTPLRGTEAMFDPDDLPWQPGQAVKSDPLEASADERNVKVLKRYKQFEPPPLERAPEPPKPASIGGDDDDDDAA